MTREGINGSVLLVQQLKEAILEGLVSRRDLVDPGAQRDDRIHQLRHPLDVEVGERELVALDVEMPERSELRDISRFQPAGSDPNSGPAEQLIHGPGGDHAAVIDHRNAVAQLLDLAEKV